MAKIASISEQGNNLGKWIWKEETNGLEFSNNGSNYESKEKRKDKRSKAGIHLQEMSLKKSERGTSASKSYGRGKALGNKSPLLRNKQTNENRLVTLQDVKTVSMDMLSETAEISQIFENLFTTEQFDQFLVYLLNYFQTFFEKRDHEQKPNPMNIEPSQTEKDHYLHLCSAVETNKRLLGSSYSILILGVGMENQHHMCCGYSRVSSTYKDRSMYETLYSFCTYIVWITFRRRENDIVKKEIGRILRSDTFNPAIRVKNAPSENSNSNEEEIPKLTPAEYRRVQGRRPAIKSIINQRSPALVSILPSPKEEAEWLFHKQLFTFNLNSLEDDLSKSKPIGEFSMTPENLRIGIIGESISRFNALTLMPVGSENDDSEIEAKNTPLRESTVVSTPQRTKLSSQPDPEPRGNQMTAASQVTMEIASDED